MKIIVNLAIISLSFLSTLRGNSNLDRISDQKILSFFEDTALSWTFSSLPRSEEKLCKKNMDGLNIYLAGDWSYQAKYIFERCARDVGLLTDLNVSFVNIDSYCNIYVGMGTDVMKDYYQGWKEKRGINTRYYDAFISNLDENFHIKHSAGFINDKFKDNEKWLEHFSYRILLVSIGFTDYSHKYQDSIFSRPFTAYSTPTDLDRAIIKLLYQKEIKPRMKIYDIKKIARSSSLLDNIRN